MISTSQSTPTLPPSPTLSSDILLRLAQASPAGLAYLASNRRFALPSHLALLSDHLGQLARGEIKRLMVFMPPRHGKSLLCSQYFPAWYIGAFRRRVILTSYGATFAASWGRLARNVLTEWGPPVFGVKVAQDSSAADHWELEGAEGQYGVMHTTGIGGDLTGRGATILIIDDPVKNMDEAQSQVMRDKTWDFYLSAAYTRLDPDGRILVIQTRWHDDDLSGRILKNRSQSEDTEPWTVLSLPAVAEADEYSPIAGGDPFIRREGAALWPERFSAERLATIRSDVGPLVWSALYQQRPAPAGGVLFKREHFRYFSAEDGGARYVLYQPDGSSVSYFASECWSFQTVDVAASTKTTADYTVVTTWVVTPRSDLLVRHVVRERFEGPDQIPLLRAQYEGWRPAMIGIESVAYQLTLVQAAIRAGLPARELKADRDKVSRALPMAARYAVGGVYHLRGASWLDAWEAEYLHFPNGGHDDMVDTGGHAARLLAEVLGEVASDDSAPAAGPPIILPGRRH